MKKTKKALLALLAYSAIFAGVFGLAACNGGDDGGDSGVTPPPTHQHHYTGTPNNDGTHNATCDGEGTCDAPTVTNGTCDELGKDGVEGACSVCGYKATTSGGEGDEGDEPEEHHHNYVNWTSDGTTTHTGTCDAEGDCDEPTKTEGHTSGEWSQANEDGVKTKTCSVCGYAEREVEGTSIRGGLTESGAVAVSGAGVYTASIRAMADGETGRYSPVGQYFKLVGGEEAKKYTVKLLTYNTTIAPTMGGYDSLDEADQTFEVVLEKGEKAVFNIVSNDGEVEQGYTCHVAFKVSESEAPAVGDILRPVKAVEGDNTQSATVGEKVYFAINHADFESDLKIKFGEGVTVYNVGLNKFNAGVAVENGYEIDENSYKGETLYMYAISTSEEFTVTVEAVRPLGTKKNPAAVVVDEADANSATFSMTDNITEQWFKLESAEGGNYSISTSDPNATFFVYMSLDGVPQESTSPIVKLEANSAAYICAKHALNNGTYTFTATKLADELKGDTADNPIIITGDGEYKLIAADTVYYEYTATENCTIKFIYGTGTASDDFLSMTCTDIKNPGGKGYKYTSGMSNVLEMPLEADKTYHFMMMQFEGETLQDKFTVTITPAE